MADVITRLKVDSQEYDSKIKRAAQGLLAMEESCRKVGGTLAILDKEEKDFVSSLGQMETVSKTARGSLGELTAAFTDLSVQYQRLTDEEKKGDFGTALNASLEQLKTRITEAKSQLDDVNKSLQDNNSTSQQSGSVLEQLASKFTINIDAITLFNKGLQAAGMALDTAKAAIETNEATHDSLARAIQVTDDVTHQFLRSLATADFSNFLNGLQDIIDKSIQAYNALDEFESFAARFQPWQQAQESDINTKLQEARAAKAKGDTQRAEQLTKEARLLIDQLAKSTEAYGKKQTESGYATIRSLMGSVDITDTQIAWYANPDNWDKAKRKAEEYARIQERINSLTQSNITSPSYDVKSRREKNQEIDALNARLAADPSLKRAYTMQNLRDSGEEGQAFRSALSNIYGNRLANARISSLYARADRMEGVVTGSGRGSGGGTTTTEKTELQQNEAEIAKLTAEYQTLGDVVKTASGDELKAAQERQTAIKKDISALQERNNELKSWAAEATNSDVTVELNGLPQLQQQLSELRKAQSSSLDGAEWDNYKTKIESVQNKIAILKGELKEGFAAQFSLEDIPEQQISVTADVSKATQEIADLEKTVDGLKFDSKTLTVTANTTEAARAVQAILSQKYDLPINVEIVQQDSDILSQDGIQTKIKELQDAIADSELGSTLFNSLTEQLGDVQMLSSFIQYAIQNGIDVAEIDPKSIWSKIFPADGNPGDYVDSKFWENLGAAFSEALGKEIEIDTKKGTISDENGKPKKETDVVTAVGKLNSGVSSMVGSLKELGVDIPKGFSDALDGISDVIGFLQSIMMIVQAIETMQTVGTWLNIFQRGGVVPHAANGYFVPGTHYSGDVTPIMANAGELVLNTSSQQQLAADILNAERMIGSISELYSMSMGATSLSLSQQDSLAGQMIADAGVGSSRPYVDGEKIYLGLCNYLSAAGIGELVIAR